MARDRPMIAFEIHTYREGQWRIDAVFDDREMAMFEAERIARGGHAAGVLVIEESYDEATNTATNRTLYRGGRFANRMWGMLPEMRRRVQRAGPQARRKSRERLGADGPTVVSGEPGPIRAALLLILIVGIGLAALLAIRYAADLLR